MLKRGILSFFAAMVVLTLSTSVRDARASAGSRDGVCHVVGTGSYVKITVSANAVPAHLAHGDALAGSGGLDDNCEPSNRVYVSHDPEQCLIIRWVCQEGYIQFYDETGCGCEPAP